MEKVEELLKKVPGFRTDTTWKKIVASNFYILHILLSLINGLDFFLMGLTLAMLVVAVRFLVIGIRDKKSLKFPLTLFLFAFILFISSRTIGIIKDIRSEEAEKMQLIQEEKLAIQKEEEKREQERIKQREEREAAEAARKEEEEKRLEEEEKARKEARQAEFEKNFTPATVTLHRDGDSVHVTLEETGEVLSVRMIGIDTPETYNTPKPIKYYAQESHDFTREQIFGKKIYLEKEISERDRWGRHLRHIWLEIPDVDEINKETIKTKLFNGVLVAKGYASSGSFSPDTKYQEYLDELEEEAKEKGIGLWNEEKKAEYDRNKYR